MMQYLFYFSTRNEKINGICERAVVTRQLISNLNGRLIFVISILLVNVATEWVLLLSLILKGQGDENSMTRCQFYENGATTRNVMVTSQTVQTQL